MSSLLESFRRQLLSTAIHDCVDLKLSGADQTPGFFADHLRPGERSLLVGTVRPQVLRDAARRLGPDGLLRVADSELSRVAELRRCAESIAAGDTAPIQVLGADCSDLRQNLECIDLALKRAPVSSVAELSRLKERVREEAMLSPIIPDGSCDAVVVDMSDPEILREDPVTVGRELCRVICPGGRLTLRVSVSDEPVPVAAFESGDGMARLRHIQTEEQFFANLERSGFSAWHILEWEQFPVELVQGVEIRHITVCAYSPRPGRRLETNQAVVYRGPWRSVMDESGNTYHRGRRTAVDHALCGQLGSEPYGSHFVVLRPYQQVALDTAAPFAKFGQIRDPRVTKGASVDGASSSCCSSDTGGEYDCR